MTPASRYRATLAAILASSAFGCASGRGAVGGAPSPPINLDGGPELVGTASLPNATDPPVVVAAAVVLQAFAWPITGVDSARGGLDSDWQYFEPAVRSSGRQGYCQNPMALRLTVRTMSPERARLALEAYVPQSARPRRGWSNTLVPEIDPARRQALFQARAVLASVRDAVAAVHFNGSADVTLRAWNRLGHELDDGSYRRCADGPR